MINLDIIYYEKYKKNLNNFISAESGNLTIGKYMRLVGETKDIEDHIKKLKQNETNKDSIRKNKEQRKSGIHRSY